MDRMKMGPLNLTDENIERIAELFPNCIVESESGKAIDFDLLKQELSHSVVDGTKERYQLNWPGKKQALLAANTPITKTLRPCREESVDFDTTQNLFVEGDNLDALKLLQETYLGKIKMVYIDPPYNTGKDFIYSDKFSVSKKEYLESSGQHDKEENRLVANTESNGRFHSDWLSMIYPRLKLARNLLRDDGVIFISIDDNEVHNMRKLCDEIFGIENFIGDIIRKTKSTTNDAKRGFNIQHENCLAYAKNVELVVLQGERKYFSKYSNPDNDPFGAWVSGDPSAKTGSINFPIKNPYTGKIDYPPKGMCWRFSEQTFKEHVETGKIKFKKKYKDTERGFIFKRYLSEVRSDVHPVNSLLCADNRYMNQVATKEGNKLFDVNVMSYPKPINFLAKLISYSAHTDEIILDFFAGSCTTAHAVMQLNAQDMRGGGGAIMVIGNLSWSNFQSLVMKILKLMRQVIKPLQILAKNVFVELANKSKKKWTTILILKRAQLKVQMTLILALEF